MQLGSLKISRQIQIHTIIVNTSSERLPKCIRTHPIKIEHRALYGERKKDMIILI